MQIKNTYPKIKSGSANRRRLLHILRWPFILLAVASVTVNLLIGEPYWCVIAVAALALVWNLVLSTDLIEYNRISQAIKAVIWSSVILLLIEYFIVSIYAVFVIPIVCFGGLIACMVFLFTDLETQKHNLLPLINFIFLSIVGSGVALYFFPEARNWPFIVLFGESVLFLIALILVLGQDFGRELKRRFHIK